MASERHVVVDARLARASGIGTYIRNTVPSVARLAPHWTFTVVVDTKDGDRSWIDLPNVRIAPATSAIFTVREQIEMPALIPRDADVFWATNYNFPLLQRKTLVVTVHDLGHLRLPEYARSVARRAYARFMFAQARRRAAALMFDSEFTRDEFHALVGPTNGSSAVVHLGVAPSWFETAMDQSPLTEPYFLYVGNIKPHKNLHVLLTAFERVSERMPARLVLIGRSENFRTADASIRARIGGSSRVALLGEVDDALARRYVRHATCLVLPSAYEGFGLPPLEAMAAGCPVIVSRAASLPEVCGSAARYFDPADADDLATAMLEMFTNGASRTALVEKGKARARQFDWSITARKAHHVLADVTSR
jgi:glycosyltransferase involved in cell wall biosynthesis